MRAAECGSAPDSFDEDATNVLVMDLLGISKPGVPTCRLVAFGIVDGKRHASIVYTDFEYQDVET